MKYIITDKQIKRVEFKYLDYLFEDMNEASSKKYPNSRFWKIDDKVVLELRISGNLWVLYSIWSDISNMFLLDYDETQQLIKEWVEEHLKLGGITPQKVYIETQPWWKNI
jgi:hypothetical protein